MKKILILLILPLLLSAKSLDIYPFDSVEQSTQFQDLLKNLRCLVCQNQDLADSNAGLAKDLRGEIYQRVSNGQSNRQIYAYLTDRYGDFVLFKPPLKANTALLWIGPFILLFIAISVLFTILYRRRRLLS